MVGGVDALNSLSEAFFDFGGGWEGGGGRLGGPRLGEELLAVGEDLEEGEDLVGFSV